MEKQNNIKLASYLLYKSELLKLIAEQQILEKQTTALEIQLLEIEKIIEEEIK